ncbi:DUF3071 domain-containing protein [Frigoribacterium sp. ACAM 257]|uniref:septation protein SepH n=1 Tax=Frigoribacterium sp. ACAM 257 TaxID=2508998 RepID=UPI0011B9D288|nr:septation protein SepH [Frigoribacterium sp. ACAM 257]TWX40638.1 DUF3071 domain-containing protein [Frigoribacterium sp. ACAM 257]
MQDLRVIGVESGALVVAADGGAEYRLPVTPSLRSQLRAAAPDSAPVERKAPPREIQSLIRSGLSPEQAAERTGADLAYVRRFEGPVLAERSHALRTALGVAVTVASDVQPDGDQSSFGGVIESRLDSADATDRHWTSYRDAEHGWLVSVSYVTQEVSRDAAWRFDPKALSLVPHAGDARALSQHSADVGPLVPRLRAVSLGRDDDEPLAGRFDSGAFLVERTSSEEDHLDEAADAPHRDDRPAAVARQDVRSPASLAATNRDPEASAGDPHAQTADLLEALRRRRGEREAARFPDDPSRDDRSAGSVRVIDVPLDDFDLPEGETGSQSLPSGPPASASGDQRPRATGQLRGGRRPAMPGPDGVVPGQGGAKKSRGRASMPSWDEIVFGARSDDDPA